MESSHEVSRLITLIESRASRLNDTGRLYAKVIVRACKDLLSTDEGIRDDAIRYFRSSNFVNNLGLTGLNTDWFRQQVTGFINELSDEVKNCHNDNTD